MCKKHIDLGIENLSISPSQCAAFKLVIKTEQTAFCIDAFYSCITTFISKTIPYYHQVVSILS